jgi:ABC-type transport system involved in cytochrome c biogenesis ATPase subunit
VLYVFGPGGVGKTSLLREFFGTCEEMGTVVGYVDARIPSTLPPTP